MSLSNHFKDRKKYYNLCNPSQPLDLGDDRYFDIDASMPDARGVSRIHEIAERIKLGDEPFLFLFSGLPGSGKSTEIRRLAARLRAETHAHLLPVVIDAEDWLDLHDPITEADILTLIAYCAEAAVLEAERKDPKKAMIEGAGARFWHWLTQTEVTADGVEVGVGAKVGIPPAELEIGPSLDLKFRMNESLRSLIRARVSSYMSTYLRLLKELLLEMNRRARSYGYEGIVIIVDSLEKMRGHSTNWRDVLLAAEKLFDGGAPFLKLPVHVVYTVPPALVNRIQTPIHFLPMLKIRDRSGNAAVGIAAGREIIRRRVPDEYLAKLFGKTRFELCMQKIVEQSGGYPREIVRILQDCVLMENEIEEREFQRILATAGERYTQVVPDYALTLLAEIARTQTLVFRDQQKDPETIDWLLQNNVLLRYQNTDSWIDLHPAVREMPKLQAELAKPAVHVGKT